MEGREWHDGGIGNQRHALFMGNLRQRLDVGHEQLRIGNNLEEQGCGLVVNLRLHFLGFREIDESRLHTKTAQRIAYQRDAVAKQVLRGHDVQACRTYRCQGIVDSRHTRIQRRHTLCACYLPDALL